MNSTSDEYLAHLQESLLTTKLSDLSIGSTNFNLNDPTDPEQQVKRGPCAICAISCRSFCAGCKTVFYCSKKHQQANWAKHKPKCRPFTIPPQYPNGWFSKGSAGTGVTSTTTPRGSTISSNNSSVKTKGKPSNEETSQEFKFMVSTREIEGGQTLFSERPLIITPHYPPPVTSETGEKVKSKCCCLGCFKQFPVPAKPSEPHPLQACKSCLLPLCKDCLKDIDDLHRPWTPWLPYHSQEDCCAVADAVAKNAQTMSQKNTHLGQNPNLVKDFSILKILMLHKFCLTKWESFIALKGNPRYSTNAKGPTDLAREWLSVDYPLSDNYIKNLFKDKSLKLEEVVKVFAIFSEVSPFNKDLRVIYELRSWIPHSCTPNTELHIRSNDPTHSIHVKTVESIKSDGVVTINAVDNYDEGTSKAAIRLFDTTGLYCGDNRCPCRFSGMDSSVGIACGLFPSKTKDPLAACTGFMCPMIDAPNPERPHLGLLIYIKSKTWNCNKCRKTEKFSAIQRQVKETGDKLKKEVDDYCKTPDSTSYSKLKESLRSSLAESHWLNWRVNKKTLVCWDRLVGNGPDILKRIVILPEGPQKRDFLKILQDKMDLYGNGVFSSTLPKAYQNLGVLTLLAKRYGRLSCKRGIYLLDAFYVNFVMLAETFKCKLCLLQRDSSKISDIITDTFKSFQILINLLEEAVFSLNLSESETIKGKSLDAAKVLETLQSVFAKCVGNKDAILFYMRELMEVYAINDPAFISQTLSKIKPDVDIIDLMFDPDPQQYLNLTFGPAYGDGGKTKSSAELPTSSYPLGGVFSASSGASGFDSKKTKSPYESFPTSWKKAKPAAAGKAKSTRSNHSAAASGSATGTNFYQRDPWDSGSSSSDSSSMNEDYLNMDLDTDDDDEVINAFKATTDDWIEDFLTTRIRDQLLTSDIFRNAFK